MNSDPQKGPSSIETSDDSMGIVFSDSESPKKNETPYSENKTSPIGIENFLKSDISAAASDSDSLEEGAIISDRFDARPTLLQHLQRAFNEWQSGAKKLFIKTFISLDNFLNEDTGDEQIVEKAKVRSNVIKEASIYTSQAPKNEFLKILTEKKQITPSSTPTIHPAHTTEILPDTQKQSSWVHTVSEPSESVESSIKKIPPLPQNLNPLDTIASIARKAKQQSNETVSAYTLISNQIEKTPLEKTSKGIVDSSVSHFQVHTVPLHKNLENDVTQPKTVARLSVPAPVIPIVPQEEYDMRYPENPMEEKATAPTQTNTDISKNIDPLHSALDIPVPEQEISSLPPPKTPVSQNSAPRSSFKIISIIGIVFFGAGAALLLNIYVHIPKKESSPVVVVPLVTPVLIPKILETDSQTQFPLPSDKKSFLDELIVKAISSTQKVSQFYPVYSSEGITRGATADEMLTLLEVHLNPQIISSLGNTLIFGSVLTSKNEPFVVLQSFNFDVLFSGMLMWEPNLQNDFSPLFGTPSTATKFTDGTVINKPTRFLLDDEGKILLLYSFVNQSTVVITTSREALIELGGRF